MKTKLLRKFRSHFDYRFGTTTHKCIFTNKTIQLDTVLIYDIKKCTEKTYTLNKFHPTILCFGTFMLQNFGIVNNRKRRKLLEKKRIKDNHKRWKDEF